MSWKSTGRYFCKSDQKSSKVNLTTAQYLLFGKLIKNLKRCISNLHIYFRNVYYLIKKKKSLWPLGYHISVVECVSYDALVLNSSCYISILSPVALSELAVSVLKPCCTCREWKALSTLAFPAHLPLGCLSSPQFISLWRVVRGIDVPNLVGWKTAACSLQILQLLTTDCAGLILKNLAMLPDVSALFRLL